MKSALLQLAAVAALLWTEDGGVGVQARHNGGSGSSTSFPGCGGPGLVGCQLQACDVNDPDNPQPVGSPCYQVNLCNDHHHEPDICDGCCDTIDLCQGFGGHFCNYDCAFDPIVDLYQCHPKTPVNCCIGDTECGNCLAFTEVTLEECEGWLNGLNTVGSYREVGLPFCFPILLPPPPPVDPPGGEVPPPVGEGEVPVGEVPPPSGGAMDDPHFLTWAGTWYDFMGECDLHLVYAPHFVSLGSSFLSLTIDIRTTMRYFYSYIANAVVKIGEDSLEVASFGDYCLNGVVNANLPATISGFPINHTQLTKHSHLFEIEIGGEEVMKLKTFKDMVSVMVEKADQKRFHGSTGMMGEYGTGKMLARDGVNVIEDPNLFAAEWQVRSNEPMLFQSTREPQHPTQCLLPQDSNKKLERRLGSMEAAKKACAHWSKETMDGCIHDVLATGDVELAQAGPF